MLTPIPVLPVVTLTANIDEIAPCSPQVKFVELSLDEDVERYAGQYCELIIAGKPYAYSIASSPVDKNIIELHIRYGEENPESLVVMHYLENEDTVEVRLPMGECVVTEVPQKPLLLIAGSTGFTGIQSIVLWLMEQTLTHDVWIYWGARTAEDLYGHEDVSHFIANSKQNFRYHGVLSDAPSESTNCFRQGMVHEAVLADAEQGYFDLSACNAIIAGSPTMAYGVYDALVAAGLPKDAAQSDVFAYAPRD